MLLGLTVKEQNQADKMKKESLNQDEMIKQIPEGFKCLKNNYII